MQFISKPQAAHAAEPSLAPEDSWPCGHGAAIRDINRAHELMAQLQAVLLQFPAGSTWSQLGGDIIKDILKLTTSALSALQSSGGLAGEKRPRTTSSASREDHGRKKSRKNEKWTVVTTVPYEDGHQWRKYGQKSINNAEHPRLVRCPKCQKLLVEYPNVSVYQCGGCGITLRTKDHVASTEGNLIAEPSQINQPESHSDRGFSDSESISGPLTSTMQCSNLENIHLEDKEQQVDFVEVVGGVENEPVKLTDAEERLQHEGIRDVFKSPATGSSLAYYDGSISSSDETRSVRMLGKSRRTFRAASNSDLKLHSGSVRSTSSLPNAARDRASSSKGSSFDSDEFRTPESWPALPKGSSLDSDEFQTVADLLALPKGSFSGELNDKVAILRKIDQLREQLVKICVPSEGRQGRASRGTIHRLQRKQQMHHCRPVSGAAPFVICAHCTKLLQLPEDFLAPRRRLYKLKCAGCDAVLDLPFPAKVQSFSEVDPAPTEPGDEPDSCIVSGGGRDVARGNLTTTPPLHRLLGYDSASDLLHGDDENDRGYAKMESTGKRGSSSMYHGVFRPGIPRPPVMNKYKADEM